MFQRLDNPLFKKGRWRNFPRKAVQCPSLFPVEFCFKVLIHPAPSLEFKHASQSLPGMMELAFGSAGADFQLGTYFFMCVAFHVMKYQHVSVACRQASDCSLQIN